MFETSAYVYKINYCKSLPIPVERYTQCPFVSLRVFYNKNISHSYSHILHTEVTVEYFTVCNLRLTLPFDTNDRSFQ